MTVHETASPPLGILQRRRIEAEIIKPIYHEMKAELGPERAQEILRRAIETASIESARRFAGTESGGTDLASFEKLQALWTQDDALEITVHHETPERFDYDVKRCRYAEMYQEMGLGEIGHLLSCNRDATFCTGYDPRIQLTRTQTIMGGASHCDFRYRFDEGGITTGDSATEARPAPNLGRPAPGDVDADSVALIEPERGRTISHGGLDALIDAAARGLVRNGLARGARVGILSANRAEFVAAYLGAMRAGIAAVPINWKLPAETIAFIAADAGIALLFADRERLALAPMGVPALSFDGSQWQAFLDPGPFDAVMPREGEIAQILYTSGSTGRPKGVPLSHAGQHWAVSVVSTEANRRDRLLVAAPMFHMNALFNVKFALFNGASLVLLPAFSAPSFIAAITRYGCTRLSGVPTMFALVARELGDAAPPAAFAGVTRIFMGSSPYSESLYERVQRLFPNAEIINGYGTTEAGPAVFGPHPSGLPKPPLAGGYPLPGSELRLVDDEGRIVEGPGAGELQMRNPAVFAGYLNLPERSQAVLRDGWYSSGDLMRRDADGFYTFIGRADDMFTTAAENIHPGEVERMLERHPSVQQAVVVPVPDEVKQALPVAFIVPRPGTWPTEDELKSFALANGPPYAHPRRVFLTEALPLAGTNKIDRRALERDAAALIAGEAVRS